MARAFFHAKLDQLATSDAVKDIAEDMEVLDHLSKSIKKRLDQILLFRYIKGECSACKGYGLFV